MFRSKLTSTFSIDKLPNLLEKKTSTELGSIDEAWLYANFRQMKELIIKLQADIDTKINQALDEIAQSKDIAKNQALIKQNREYESNLRRMAAYINPLAQTGHLFNLALQLLITIDLLSSKKPRLRELAPMLHARIKANKNLHSDADKMIVDSDLTPLLLNGQLLPFYDKLSDLYEFTLDASYNAAVRLFDPSPVMIDEKVYIQNATRLYDLLDKLDKKLQTADIDLFKMLDLVTREELKALFAELPKTLKEIDITSEEARLLSMILDGALTTFAKKFIETAKELRNYLKLTAPLYKSTQESKLEPLSIAPTPATEAESKREVTTEETERDAQIDAAVAALRTIYKAPKADATPKAEPAPFPKSAPAPLPTASERKAEIKSTQKVKMFKPAPKTAPTFKDSMKQHFDSFRRKFG